MLESLVNDDQATAEELFHEYVVEKSREIYEGLIESELDLEEGDDQTDDFMKDVAADGSEEHEAGESDAEEKAEHEEGGEEEGEEEGEEGEDEPATKGDINSLTDAVRQLEAELAQMMGHEGSEEGHEGGMGEPEELEIEDLDSMGQGFGDLETVREYVEKVGAGHGAEKKGSGESNVNAKSVVAGKNDMGGTAANIVGGGEGSEAGTTGGLLAPQTKDQNGGNVNVPGSKNATKLSPVTKGHGAEKKGASEEGGTSKTSLFRK